MRGESQQTRLFQVVSAVKEIKQEDMMSGSFRVISRVTTL